ESNQHRDDDHEQRLAAVFRPPRRGAGDDFRERVGLKIVPALGFHGTRECSEPLAKNKTTRYSSAMLNYKSTAVDPHWRDEEMQWARVLSSGDAARGMTIIFMQKLCTAFHEFEPAF